MQRTRPKSSLGADTLLRYGPVRACGLEHSLTHSCTLPVRARGTLTRAYQGPERRRKSVTRASRPAVTTPPPNRVTGPRGAVRSRLALHRCRPVPAARAPVHLPAPRRRARASSPPSSPPRPAAARPAGRRGVHCGGRRPVRRRPRRRHAGRRASRRPAGGGCHHRRRDAPPLWPHPPLTPSATAAPAPTLARRSPPRPPRQVS